MSKNKLYSNNRYLDDWCYVLIFVENEEVKLLNDKFENDTSITRIQRGVDLNQTTTIRIVEFLTSKELVYIVEAKDKRKKIVMLTHKGRDTAKYLNKVKNNLEY